MSLEQQISTFNNLVLAVSKATLNIDENISHAISINLDTIFVKESSNSSSSEKELIFSYKTMNTYQKSCFNDSKLSRHSLKKTCSLNIIQMLIEEMKRNKVDLILKDDLCKLERQERMKGLKIKKQLGRGSYGMVYEVETSE